MDAGDACSELRMANNKRPREDGQNERTVFLLQLFAQQESKTVL
jgi:hypothetical protein